MTKLDLTEDISRRTGEEVKVPAKRVMFRPGKLLQEKVR